VLQRSANDVVTEAHHGKFSGQGVQYSGGDLTEIWICRVQYSSSNCSAVVESVRITMRFILYYIIFMLYKRFLLRNL